MRVVLDNQRIDFSSHFHRRQLKILFQSGRKERLRFYSLVKSSWKDLRVLAYPKFKLSRQEIRGLIEGDLLPFVEIVNPGRRLKVVITDPSDDKFLECAVSGKADILISGDKALSAIGRYRKVQIQSPSQFLDAFFG